MKRYLVFTLVSFIIYSCWNEVKEKISTNNEHTFNLVSYLEDNDSVSCWTTQWENYFDLNTKGFQSAISLYNGAYIVTEDSIYTFYYPCEYFGSESYKIRDKNIYLDGKTEKDNKIWINRDSLYIENVGDYMNSGNETEQFLTVETYFKRTFSSKEFLYLIKNKKMKNCDTSQVFIETTQNWLIHDNLVGDLDSYFNR